MRVSWSANDFRHARMALIGVSFASCASSFAAETLLGIAPAAFFHPGLLLSLLFEHRGWLARTVGAVLLLPSVTLAALVVEVGAPGRPVLVTAVVAYALAHAAQLWRLAGLPIPPLHPLAAPVTDDSFHLQTAQGERAERIAGR